MAQSENPSGDPLAAVDDVKQRVLSGMEEIEDEARGRAERLGSGLGQHAGNVAEAVRTAGESLRGKEEWLADAADGLSRNLEQLSAAVREKGVDGLKRDAERLARERPILFMGAAVAAGLALGRVLRASAPETVRGDPATYRAAAGGDTATSEVATPPTGPGWPGAQPAGSPETTSASAAPEGGHDGSE